MDGFRRIGVYRFHLRGMDTIDTALLRSLQFHDLIRRGCRALTDLFGRLLRGRAWCARCKVPADFRKDSE
jgi:hypothetical protein